MVDRYDCGLAGTREDRAEMFVCDNGDYVRYSDYAALEAQLAEAKEAFEQISDETVIDDNGETCLSEAAEIARHILSALEATPPAPKVSDIEQAKQEAIDALIEADDVWTDYGSGFRVHFSFNAGSNKMGVVERINTARSLNAAQEAGKP